VQVAAATVVVLALVAGLVVSLVAWRRAFAADQRAQADRKGFLLLAELVDLDRLKEAAAGLTGTSAKEVIAAVRFYGRTTGGLEVETPEFYVPVRVYKIDELCDCGGTDATLGVIGCLPNDMSCM
jgi:hypothetical protein